jgi:hypothetical protein
MWSNPALRGGLYPPGLGLRGTQLLFPISTELAILGAFELEEGVIEADEMQVAQINGCIVLHARHQIYARDENFPYIFKSQSGVRRGPCLLQDLVRVAESNKGAPS